MKIFWLTCFLDHFILLLYSVPLIRVFGFDFFRYLGSAPVYLPLEQQRAIAIAIEVTKATRSPLKLTRTHTALQLNPRTYSSHTHISLKIIPPEFTYSRSCGAIVRPGGTEVARNGRPEPDIYNDLRRWWLWYVWTMPMQPMVVAEIVPVQANPL